MPAEELFYMYVLGIITGIVIMLFAARKMWRIK
jgi:hypothetical protein